MSVQKNWGGNLTYGTSSIATPRSVEELADLVEDATNAGTRLRALGTRHSFSDIADTSGRLVSLARLPQRIEIDSARRTARVAGGTPYADVAVALEREGWALANLASLPHISVAGAVATGTHGSGDALRSLSASVSAMQLVTANGLASVITRAQPDFAGAVVSLGRLGIVASVWLDIEPSYSVEQRVYGPASWDALLAGWDAVTSSGTSVSIFTAWADPERVQHVVVKTRTDAAPAVADAVLRAGELTETTHPVHGADPRAVTEQRGIAGRWHERLPHFRAGMTPSFGAEIQSEWLIDRRDVATAIEALRPLAADIAPLLLVSEVRTVAADDLWLSPSSGRDSVALHFTWKLLPEEVAAIVPRIEAALPENARPHWGKVSARTDVGALYPRWDDFRAMAQAADPRGTFANAYTDRLGL